MIVPLPEKEDASTPPAALGQLMIRSAMYEQRVNTIHVEETDLDKEAANHPLMQRQPKEKHPSRKMLAIVISVMNSVRSSLTTNRKYNVPNRAMLSEVRMKVKANAHSRPGSKRPPIHPSPRGGMMLRSAKTQYP
jgi:hypothetical protein